jgi:hypothetical protein
MAELADSVPSSDVVIGLNQCFKNRQTGTGISRFDRLAHGLVRTGTKTDPAGWFMIEPAGFVINRPVRSGFPQACLWTSKKYFFCFLKALTPSKP